MSAFTPAQRYRAIGLYKNLIRTARNTFQSDQATAQAWQLEVRKKFGEARNERDTAKIEEGLAMWDEVVDVLRRNVVQGKYSEDSQAYHLRLTSNTELGNNEDIRKGRQKQIDDLKASKGARPQCGGATSNSIAGPSASRAFHTSSRLMTSSSSNASDSGSNNAKRSSATSHFPRPVPHFPMTAFLSDGSSIKLSTTSPRSTVRLTRDPTNHPLWNPGMDRKGGAGDDDESGRLGRFRRRFGGTEDVTAAGAGKEGGKAAPASQDGGFGEKDLEWMSVGGREARAGTPIASKKGAKGKGKK